MQAAVHRPVAVARVVTAGEPYRHLGVAITAAEIEMHREKLKNDEAALLALLQAICRIRVTARGAAVA